MILMILMKAVFFIVFVFLIFYFSAEVSVNKVLIKGGRTIYICKPVEEMLDVCASVALVIIQIQMN